MSMMTVYCLFLVCSVRVFQRMPTGVGGESSEINWGEGRLEEKNLCYLLRLWSKRKGVAQLVSSYRAGDKNG